MVSFLKIIFQKLWVVKSLALSKLKVLILDNKKFIHSELLLFPQYDGKIVKVSEQLMLKNKIFKLRKVQELRLHSIATSHTKQPMKDLKTLNGKAIKKINLFLPLKTKKTCHKFILVHQPKAIISTQTRLKKILRYHQNKKLIQVQK